MSYRFYSDCCSWPQPHVGDLIEMVDNNREITRQTFMRHVPWVPELRQIEKNLGYAWYAPAGMTMASDWHVSYHKSKLAGHTVYYFRWSAIEYVFVPEDFKWRTE